MEKQFYHLNIIIDTKNWDNVANDMPLELLSQKIVSKFFGKKAKICFNLLLSDDKRMQKLNYEFKGQNKATNVLSFPLFDSIDDIEEEILDPTQIKEDKIPIGDIICAYSTIEKEAKEQNKTLKDHTTHMVLHGVMHLLGFHHEYPEDERTMEQYEIEILKELKIKNPYIV